MMDRTSPRNYPTIQNANLLHQGEHREVAHPPEIAHLLSEFAEIAMQDALDGEYLRALLNKLTESINQLEDGVNRVEVKANGGMVTPVRGEPAISVVAPVLLKK